MLGSRLLCPSLSVTPDSTPPRLGSGYCTAVLYQTSQLTLNPPESAGPAAPTGRLPDPGPSHFSSVAPRQDPGHRSPRTKPDPEHPRSGCPPRSPLHMGTCGLMTLVCLSAGNRQAVVSTCV